MPNGGLKIEKEIVVDTVSAEHQIRGQHKQLCVRGNGRREERRREGGGGGRREEGGARYDQGRDRREEGGERTWDTTKVMTTMTTN